MERKINEKFYIRKIKKKFEYCLLTIIDEPTYQREYTVNINKKKGNST